MWYAQRGPSRGDPEIVGSIRELLPTSSRGFVLVSLAACLVWHVGVTVVVEVLSMLG